MNTAPMSTPLELLNPPDRQDEFTERMRDVHGYIGAKRADDGTYIGILPLMFTMSICVGVTEISPFKKRYCYEDITECMSNYDSLDDSTFTPSGYIATRG